MTRTLTSFSTFRLSWLLAAGLFGVSVFDAPAGQDAAPSSHMVFDDNFEGDIVINDVRVPAEGEAMYTYYEALGWSGKAGGYAGIQAHPKAHNYIFSIWDDKSHSAPIKAVYRGPGTLTENFGGEGTGLKSWNFELGWDTGTWYTLVSCCWPVDGHTFYGYWVRSAKTGEWTHMVTMDVAAEDAYFQGGTDAFIEDWLETGKNARTTHLRDGWKRKRDGTWHAFGEARYSVNAWDLDEGKRSFHFRANWNGGVAKDADGEYYFMTAGGEGTMPTAANPSSHAIKRASDRPGYAAIRVLSAKARVSEGGKVVVSWENDPATLPQFGYTLTAYGHPEGKGEPLARFEEILPHGREVEWTPAATVDAKQVTFHLRCRDVLDNESALLSIRLGE